jgi:Mrp family chromosome partitioning ATPase
MALLRGATRRPLLASAVAGVLGLAAGLVLWRITPLHHTAEARLEVKRAPAGIVDADGADAAAELYGQAELIKNPAVVDRAAEDPSLQQIAAERGATAADLIARAVKVEAISHESTLYIRATDARADDAVAMVRGLTNAYINELKTRRERHLLQLQEALERARAATVAQAPGPEPVPAPREVADPRLAAAEKMLTQVRDDRRKAAAELATLRDLDRPPPEPVVTDEAVDQAYAADPFVLQKLRELKPIEDVIQNTLRIAVLGEKEPSLQSYLQRRDAIRKDLAARRSAIRKALEAAARTNPPGPDLKPQIKTLEERVANLTRQEQTLEADIKALRAAESVVPPPPPVVRVQPPPASETRRKLEDEIRQIEARGPDAYWVTPLGESVAVEAASLRKRRLLAGLGGAGGILVGLLLVGRSELRSRRVRTVRDVADSLGIPVFAALPKLKVTPETLAGTARDDPVDALRSALLIALPAGPCVILVTSAGPGEGKSELAAHLAASLARTWHKTVLISADLSRPELQHGSDMTSAPGLAEVLRGEAEALDALHVTPLTRLWLMAAGRVNPAAIDALARGEAAAALEPLREQFDCVIIDAAALGRRTDALSFASLADVALLAVHVHVSSLPEVHTAWRRLERAGCPVAGAAVLGATGAFNTAIAPSTRLQETAAVA